MSTTQSVLATVLALIAVAGIAGGLWAVFRSAAQDARIKRLQDERDDYLSRLNYIEPRLVEASEQNKVLRELHNPANAIDQLRAQGQQNHEQTVEILNNQTRTLQDAIRRSHET